MKIIAISDTHGREDRILSVLRLHKSYDALVFLGDGVRDLELSNARIDGLVGVSGNCDVFSPTLTQNFPSERMLCMGDFKILILHGHIHGVKSGSERVAQYAYSRGADVVLHGHTHKRSEVYYAEGTELGGVVTDRPIRVFCPGSLGCGRDVDASFGVIEIRGGQILFSYGEV